MIPKLLSQQSHSAKMGSSEVEPCSTNMEFLEKRTFNRKQGSGGLEHPVLERWEGTLIVCTECHGAGPILQGDTFRTSLALMVNRKDFT